MEPYGYGYPQYGHYMPPPAAPKFEIGWVLSNSFSIFFRNLPSFLAMSALTFAPLLIYGLLASYPDVSGGDELDKAFQVMPFTFMLAGATMLLQPLLIGAVTHTCVEELAGRKPTFGRSLSVGFQRLLPSIAVGVLVFICTMLGVLALIIGAFFVMVMLYVAVPVSVIEKPGLLAALSRSAELTKGCRWWILLIMIIGNVMNGILATVLELVMVKKETVDGIEVIQPESWTTYVWIHIGTTAVGASLVATFCAVTYVGLRNIKDGVHASDLAGVFD